MNKKAILLAAAIPLVMGLGGCDKVKRLIGGKPKGQVVATVNGEEITTLQLQSELGGFRSKDPKVIKAAEQQALQQIILRDLLAQKAREAKIDKTPEYTMQLRRGQDTLLAQLYERKLASGVAQPSRQEAEEFVSTHPEMFAQRKVIIVDQIIGVLPKVNKEQIEAIKTLEDVKQLFNSENAPFQENTGTLDTLTANPQMTAQIEHLPPGEVFVTREGEALAFSRLTDIKTLPITGDLAVNYAINALRNQKAQTLLKTQIEALRKGAEKSITYSADFKPPPPKPAAPAGAAPAAGAAAPAAQPAAK
ncbi:MAG: EpsD family peptidyl-prolyl cis-trans isomerase [Phenylobacterium sp.]